MNNLREDLLTKINNRQITIGVVGLGYVGLPLAVEMAKAGFTTIGFDVNPDKVAALNGAKNYINDVDEAELTAVVSTRKLWATDDFSRVGEVDFIAICVPTPLDAYQQPDISYVETSTKAIAQHITPGTMIVLESTTYPGTTEELIKPILEEGSGLTCGEGFYLGFSPERVDPGNAKFKTNNTPKVIGAIGEEAKELITAVYSVLLGASKVHTVSTPAIAEMTKILENTYRNINIGLINELAILCHRMGINIWEVIEAAKTKPFGFTAFYPGPGLGGHCIPLDPYYLGWKAREYGFYTSMIEASMMINDRMPEYTVERCIEMLNRVRKPLNGSKILILGVAYKQNIDDYRESAALHVIDLMQQRGAEISFYDPYIQQIEHKGKSFEGVTQLDEKVLQDTDIVVITTAHTNVDYGFVQQHASMIFDARNATGHLADRHNIELL